MKRRKDGEEEGGGGEKEGRRKGRRARGKGRIGEKRGGERSMWTMTKAEGDEGGRGERIKCNKERTERRNERRRNERRGESRRKGNGTNMDIRGRRD